MLALSSETARTDQMTQLEMVDESIKTLISMYFALSVTIRTLYETLFFLMYTAQQFLHYDKPDIFLWVGQEKCSLYDIFLLLS